jgi:uncharacterized RDD family membrane protein YckC
MLPARYWHLPSFWRSARFTPLIGLLKHREIALPADMGEEHAGEIALLVANLRVVADPVAPISAAQFLFLGTAEPPLLLPLEDLGGDEWPQQILAARRSICTVCR